MARSRFPTFKPPAEDQPGFKVGADEAAPEAVSRQRRGVLAGMSVGATALLLGCGKDPSAPPTPGPAPAIPGTGGQGPAGSGGTAGGGASGTGGASGPPSATDAATGPAGTGGAAGANDAASGDGSMTVADGARIEVGAPPPKPPVDGGANAMCVQTRSDQLGPYHLQGHLNREAMATPNDGMPLAVSGRVLDAMCRPLVGAVVDVWAANGRGVYSETPTGWCRGKVVTAADGSYKFQIVYPGPYQGRPRHLHIQVSQPGFSRLTTQMYFKGERPDIPANAVDKTLSNGVLQSEFNIVLRGSGSAENPLKQPFEPGKLHRRFWGGWNKVHRFT